MPHPTTQLKFFVMFCESPNITDLSRLIVMDVCLSWRFCFILCGFLLHYALFELNCYFSLWNSDISMVPLDTLDRYMIICGVVGVTYIMIMLGILLCFLKKYNCNAASTPTCQQIEMQPVPQPYQYTIVNHSSDSVSQSCATRSMRSYNSRQSSHIYHQPQVKKVMYIKTMPDFSQMERLATL